MNQMLFCGFKNIFTSNKNQLPSKISSPLTSTHNPFPFPSKKQGGSNKKKEKKRKKITLPPVNKITFQNSI